MFSGRSSGRRDRKKVERFVPTNAQSPKIKAEITFDGPGVKLGEVKYIEKMISVSW